jgi:glycosyltransferase involved in cell wall biosynthesis
VVVSVHDVSYLEHPEYFPWARAQQLKITVRRTIGRAAKILTPSEFSKRGIMKAYGVSEDKIDVVPNAVSSDFHPRSQEKSVAHIRQQYGIPEPYILSVGDLVPRKNQVRLLKAFEELLRFYPDLPHHLVLVGKDGWYGSRVRKAAERSGLANRIHFTGFVSDEELMRFYGGCDFFVFPSLYEGFGLPILEAMASGRAVACSDGSAMPEVADSSALLFNPESVEEMTLAMRDLALDPELRARVARLGAQHASAYSWRNAAEKTLETYYAVAAGKREVRSFTANPVSVSRV